MPIVLKSGSLNLLEPLGPSRPVMGLLYPVIDYEVIRILKVDGHGDEQ